MSFELSSTFLKMSLETTTYTYTGIYTLKRVYVVIVLQVVAYLAM